MKKLLMIFAIGAMMLAGCGGKSQKSEPMFPDAAFEMCILAEFDTDKDGKISPAEAAAVEQIDVRVKTIGSLKGIENFTNLTYLECSHNPILSLDLSKNTALKELYCAGNQLSSLDLSNNTVLTMLNCGDNELTSLNLSNNTALTKLYCGDNKLTSLDLTGNTALEELSCGMNQLTSLDVSKNTALTWLDCRNNPNVTELFMATGHVISNLFKNDCAVIIEK